MTSARRRSIVLLVPIAVLAFVFAPAHAVTLTDVRFTMDDGVDLVADIYLPAGSGPFPCVVELTPYRKALRATEGAGFLPGEGIALIEVDARGTGNSEGEYDIVFSMREQRDTAAVIDMAADLLVPGVGDVCLPRVGMYGGSYSGIIQYLVATLPEPYAPKHLAAIAPQRAFGDLYRDIVYHGGMVIGSFGAAWSSATTGLYTVPPTNIDTPEGQAALVDHLTRNDPMMMHYLQAPFIDATYSSNGTWPAFTQQLYADSSALPRIQNLRVPALHLAGWFDAFTRGQMMMFDKALEQESDGTGRGPNYLIVGPWNHTNTHFITPENKPGLKAALAGWYKHWLAGSGEPDFMSGPRIQYYRMGTGSHLDTTGAWEASNQWPPTSVSYERYYLRSGGKLSTAAPGAEADDSYVWNPTAGTAEILSRWDNAIPSAPFMQWDQRLDEPKGLSYTTEPFTTATTIAGTANLHLRASTAGLPGAGPIVSPGLQQLVPPYHDTDFVVKVSDVAPDGSATLITQGYLRASHRALEVAQTEYSPSGDVVQAMHPHIGASVSPPGAKEAYEIEIWPTAKTFAAGHSIRLDIYSADTPNHLTLLKPALNTVHHSAGLESWLLLPVVR